MSTELRVGDDLGPSRWLDVDQRTIETFAACTHDAQWIHVDRARAAAGPFGTTIAQGFLTLSLCVSLLYDEREGQTKPVCVADIVLRLPTANGSAG